MIKSKEAAWKSACSSLDLANCSGAGGKAPTKQYLHLDGIQRQRSCLSAPRGTFLVQAAAPGGFCGAGRGVRTGKGS